MFRTRLGSESEQQLSGHAAVLHFGALNGTFDTIKLAKHLNFTILALLSMHYC